MTDETRRATPADLERCREIRQAVYAAMRAGDMDEARRLAQTLTPEVTGCLYGAVSPGNDGRA